MSQWSKLIHSFDLHSTGKWFFLSTTIGVIAGLGAIVFQFLSEGVQALSLGLIAGYVPEEAAGEIASFGETTTGFIPWLILPVMIVGGLLSGWIVYTFAPEAEGHGTDSAIDAFHNKRGEIRGRIPIVKTIASAITLGTGGSAGREGPIAQIGAGFGSFLATRLRLSARDRRILLAAGMGAGVGAIFRAPLAGALFAGEIMYRDADLDSDVIVPAAVSSTVAYSVFCLSLPPQVRFVPLFGDKLEHHLGSPLELFPYAVLAIVLTLVGVLYIKTFYGMQKLFRQIPIWPHLRPAIGAGLAGVIGLALFYAFGQERHALSVLSTGYGALQNAFTSPDSLSIQLLLCIALLKIVTTSLTISSGGSGGVFGPSMVIGGCMGAAVGKLFHGFWPDLVTEPQTYAIVGMAGFFAGCARAPFSTILMVSEMTGDYQLLLPTMWVSTLCFLLGRKWTLYQKQVPTRLDSPAHRGEFIVDVLEGIKVDDVYRKGRSIKLVHEATTMDDIVHMLATTNQRYFPVIDDEGRMIGIFSSDDVRSYLYDDVLWQIAIARDVMVTRIVSVSPQDDLNMALRSFTALNLDELPVVDPQDSSKLLGMLRRKETIAAYNRQILEHKQHVDAEQFTDIPLQEK